MNATHILSKALNLACISSFCALLLSACSQDAPRVPDTKNEYTVNWIKAFGLIDENQNWNMAEQATVSLSHEILQNGGYAEVYTSNPLGGGKYLGRITRNNHTTNVDLVKGSKSIYVKFFDVEENLITSQYVDVINGNAQYISSRAMSRSSECNVTISSTYTGTIRIPDPTYNLDKAKELGDAHYWEFNVDGDYKWVNGLGEKADALPEGDYNNYNPQRPVTLTFAHMAGNTTSTVKEMQIKDLLPIVGSGNPVGKFKEGVDNRELFKDVFEKDVIFKAQGGPVDVKFQFGGTAFHNMFGYYYWQDGEDSFNTMKYILMEDALPQHNVYYGEAGTEVTDGMSWPSIITSAAGSEDIQNTYAVATQYNLVYFDGETASYDFPKGTNIAFFMISAGQTTGHFPEEENYLNYYYSSISEHNLVMGRKFTSQDFGEVSAVTYKASGNVVLGFEDGIDKDMNDVLFFLEGVQGTGIKEVINPVAEPQRWIIACEDLGSTDDYDFNDIVLSVSYTIDEDHIHVYPLAAGGVLTANVYHTDNGNKTSVGEIHYMLNKSQAASGNHEMINTRGYQPMGTMLEIPITGEFSMATNMGGFSIEVEDKDKTVTINAPLDGEAPQMMCLPDGWQWPSERTRIEEAYPSFANWSSNSESTDWIKSVVNTKVINWK